MKIYISKKLWNNYSKQEGEEAKTVMDILTKSLVIMKKVRQDTADGITSESYYKGVRYMYEK